MQLECYGFNDRAIRHFERAGFTKEGVKRKAYWRHDEWVDGIVFGLVREDLEPACRVPTSAAARPVCRWSGPEVAFRLREEAPAWN